MTNRSAARDDAIALGVLLALCVVLFRRALFAGSDAMIWGIDIVNTYYPYKFFIKEAYLSGQLPLWNPYYYCGHPFAANSWAAPFYPPDAIFLCLSLPRAINISLFLHVLLVGVFMYLWMKNFVRGTSALVGAVTFMLCGFLVARLPAGHFGMIRTAAYVPVVFWCYERAMRSRGAVWILVGGFAVGMQLLVGHPQIFYYTALFLGLYAVGRFASDPQARTAKGAGRLAIVLGGMALFGAATAALGLLPLIEMSLLSVRAEASYHYVSIGSMHPLQVLRLFFPDLPMTWTGVVGLPYSWEWDTYVGILPLFLAGVALTIRRKHAVLFGVLAAAALIVAFGSYTPVFKVLYLAVPGVRLFRLHARALLMFMFFAATLAGMGAATVIEMNEQHAEPSRKTLPLVWTLVSLAVVLFVFLNLDILFKLLYKQMPLCDRKLLLPLAMIVLATAVVWLVSLKKLPPSWLRGCLVAAIAADLILTGWNRLPVREIDGHYSRLSPLMERVEVSRGRFRVFLHDSVFPPNMGMVRHIESVSGTTPVALKRTIRYLEAATGVTPFRFAHNYLINPECFKLDQPFPFKILDVRYSMTYDDGFDEPRLVENEHPFPRALWIPRAEVLPGAEAVLEKVVSNEFDPYKSVLLEEDPGIPVATEAADVSWVPAEITDYRNDRITVTVDAPRDGWLLMSEQYYPGWKAWCDGQPVPLYRADYLLRAAPVPSGRHTIDVKYRPASFIAGAALSGCAVIVLLVAVALSALKARGRNAPAETD